MNDPLAAARELLAAARERYPAPLAAVASELLYELSAVRPNHMRCFLLQIDLFEVSVAFFGFIQVAQLHRAAVPLKACEAAVLQLRDNPGLCTGHWWGLLRETSRDVQALPDEQLVAVAREIAGVYFEPAGKSARLGTILDQVPGLRNRVKGHAWTLPDEQYEAHSRELLATVVGYLSCLDFLQRHTLFQCLACEPAGSDHLLDLSLLVGDARRPRRQQVRSGEPLVATRLYIARKDDLDSGSLTAAAVLELHPFVQVRAHEKRPEALYLVQGLSSKEAELRSAVGGVALSCPLSGQQARALLDALVGRSASLASPFGRFRDAVTAISREALTSAQGLASYRPEAYQVRPRVLRQVEDFAASGHGLALLAAPSGMGKTALACFLVDRWLISASKTEAVLLVFAHELAMAQESLDHWSRRRLGFALTDLGQTAERAGARVLILVDGLERARDQRAVLREAVALQAAGPLRFLFTITDSVLPELLKGPPLLESGPPPLVVIPPLSPAEGKKLYELFHGQKQGPDAVPPPDELLALLGTPLLIRLAQSAARSGGDLSAGQVLLAYTEQVVFSDLARTELVTRLADRVIDSGARTVPVSVLAGDEWMRTALLSDSPDGVLRGLVRDGVLFVEWVPPGGPLPLPAEPHVGFTFDQLRDFVVFTRLCRRWARNGMLQLEESPGRDSASAPSLPLLGGMRFLVLERLRTAAAGAPPTEVHDLLLRLGRRSRDALLHELFLVPTGPRLARALAGLFRALFAALDPGEQKGFLEAARGAFDHLERRGLVSEAGSLCTLASELGLAAHPGQVLPLLCAWSRLQGRTVGAATAEATARSALSAAEALADKSFQAEAVARLGEALDSAGRRQEAFEVLATEMARLRPELAETSGLSESSRFALCLAAASVLHGHDRELAQQARAMVQKLARESRRPTWLAESCLAEAGYLQGSPALIGTEQAIRLTEEALESARQAGSPSLQAQACRVAAWCWQRDTSRELTLIETGLEAADAGKDLASRAELLMRQGAWLLRVGQPAAAEEPAHEAADLFARLGYRERSLRLRQHVLLMIAFELGRPGEAFALLSSNLGGFRDIGLPADAALSALLLAGISCESGDALAVRAFLSESRQLAQQAGTTERLNFDLVTGRVLQLEGKTDEAFEILERAREWGRQVKFADFVYQPGIHSARLLLQRQDGDKDDLGRADTLLQGLLEDQTVDRRNRDRYEGEICTLYAQLLGERGNMEQAEVWLTRADSWFARNPLHRGVAEWKATRLVLDWLTAERLEQTAGPAATEKPARGGRDERGTALKRAQGLKTSVRKRVRADVLSLVAAAACTFSDPHAAEGFEANHPAVRLLRRHGITPA